jgi:tetratricopeptide (TPR) repeat protein
MALSNHPNPDEALREIGFSQERQGNLEEAERSFREAVALDDDYWVNWNRLGSFYISLGRYTDARDALERAAALAPPEVGWPQENLAVLELLEGRFEEAILLFDQIPRPIDDATLAGNIGVAYYFTDRPDALQQAEHYFELAVRLEPKDHLNHRNLADLYLRLNEPEKARVHYLHALENIEAQLEIDSNNPQLRLERSLYLARSGSCDRATSAAKALRAELTVTATGAHNLAYTFALCGKDTEALDSLRVAIEQGISPDLIRQEDEFQSLFGNPEFQQLTSGAVTETDS